MIRTHLIHRDHVECGVPLEAALAPPTTEHGGGQPPHISSVWLDIEAPTPEEIRLLTDHFRFHPLAVEDCVHEQRRAKLERYQSHGFLVVCALDRVTRHELLDTTPICIFVRPRLVVSVHPKRVTAVDRVVQIMESEPDRIGNTSERILHAIIDAVVDEFVPLLEDWEDALDPLAERAGRSDEAGLMSELTRVRRELLSVRRIILPLLEVVKRLIDEDATEVSGEARVYFRDVQDHGMVVSEMTQLLLEVVNGAASVQATAVNERINQVMKYLAIVSTLLLPWTVVSGIFGMNFDIIPFAHQPAGFLVALSAMVGLTAALLYFFYRRGWFGGR